VLLRFLAVCDDEVLSNELVDDAILPALARMRPLSTQASASPGSPRNAYLGVLAALELVLAAERPEAAASVVDETEREWARDRDSLGIDRQWCGH
jgi:hypothetical protein